jgi:class 3 adenylate cyclase
VEPVVQYCTTDDGVRIGCYAIGDGPPVVILPFLPVSHIELEREVQDLRYWYTWLSGHRRVIRYDARGTATSERVAPAISLDDHLRDLQAVLARFGVERCDIVAGSFAGPIALAFAALYPDRVRRIALWTTHATSADVDRRVGNHLLEQRDAIDNLLKVDTGLFLRTWLQRAVGWPDVDQGGMIFRIVTEAIDAEALPRLLRAYRDFDATDALDRIEAPVLVMHRRDFPGSHLDVARDLVARLKHARLMAFEGTSIVPFAGDPVSVLRAFDDFFGDEGLVHPREPLRGAASEPVLRTILFTDIEGHTGITQRLGDSRTREILRAHEQMTRDALRLYGGVEVKTMGDGFLASFASATRALECAVALQRGFDDFSQSQPSNEQLRVRVGVNAGEPIAEDGDLFGSSVIAAARIAALAAGGQVLVANVVRELVQGKGFEFAGRGETVLSGFEEPVRLWELRWHE